MTPSQDSCPTCRAAKSLGVSEWHCRGCGDGSCPENASVLVRAVDVVPNHWALWCSIADGEPFANPICHKRWSEDGKRVVFMLDSFNFLFAEPDEELELLPRRPSEGDRERGLNNQAAFLAREACP